MRSLSTRLKNTQKPRPSLGFLQVLKDCVPLHVISLSVVYLNEVSFFIIKLHYQQITASLGQLIEYIQFYKNIILTDKKGSF
jgi:hypothetical protein